jgi:pimeloyl-ACP methyl ester carboxylesterase
MNYVDLHGERIAYRDTGAGEALLLIHGMAGSSATWRAVIPELSKKYRVVAPDLLGHGESAKPRGDYSLGAFAVSLRDLLDELGISRATVVGQSLGGGVGCSSPINIATTASDWLSSAAVASAPT